MTDYTKVLLITIALAITGIVKSNVEPLKHRTECGVLSEDNKATVEIYGITATDYGNKLYNNSRMKKPLTIRYTAYVNDNSDCTVRFDAKQLEENFKLVYHRDNMNTSEIPNDILSAEDGYFISSDPYLENSFIDGYELPISQRNKNSKIVFNDDKTIFLSVSDDHSGALSLCAFAEGPLVEDSPFLKYKDCTNRPISQESTLQITTHNFSKDDITVNSISDSLQCRDNCEQYFTYDEGPDYSLIIDPVPLAVERVYYQISLDGVGIPHATKLRVAAHTDWNESGAWMYWTNSYFDSGIKIATLCIQRRYNEINNDCGSSWNGDDFSAAVLALYNGIDVKDTADEHNVYQHLEVDIITSIGIKSSGKFRFIRGISAPNNGFSFGLYHIDGYANAHNLTSVDNFNTYPEDGSTFFIARPPTVVTHIVQDNYGNLSILSVKFSSRGDDNNQRIEMIDYDLSSCDHYTLEEPIQGFSSPYCYFMSEHYGDEWWKTY
ncbi:hypothetical protein [Zooshikella sp. RANM57]|uniref:hypothetical protein n=1 Tax=Zooshikella sp. RANM57 TaxID=3425863 RepID=UPI003D6EFB0F